MLMKTYLSDWLALRAPSLAPRTIESYSDLLRRYIIPALGNTPVTSLNPLDITHMLARISADGHSRTAELCYVLLASACATLSPSPMVHVSRPSHVQKTPEAWSDAHIRLYLAAVARHRHRVPFTLAIALGLRRGEICGLRWCDIDFATNTIHIVNQRQRLASGEIVDLPPKSRTSVRDIPIPPSLLPMLRAHRQIAGYLCPISPSGLDAAHRALVRSLALPYIPLHGLRHTMATSCIRHGGDMRSLQKLLGHASYATTANRYTHPDTTMLLHALDCAARFVV